MYKMSIKERMYIKILWNTNIFLPFCRVLWYQLEKQRLCKSINDRFLIKTVMTSNYNIEKLKETTSKQLTRRTHN
jgi:hypothetical protein